MTVALAQTFPSAQVYGLDLAPVPQTSTNPRPPNVQYIQGNIHDLLGQHPDLQPGTFDYIYSRYLLATATPWLKYLDQIATLLNPGGWLEMTESSITFHSGSGEAMPVSPGGWFETLCKDSRAQGIDLQLGDSLLRYLEYSSEYDSVAQETFRNELRALPATPELWTIQGQHEEILRWLARKVCGACRSKEEVGSLVKGIEEYFERDYRLGDHFLVYDVVARKRRV